MRHHISIRGSVRPSVCPSTCPYVHPYVRYAFSKTKADPIIEVLMAHRVARLGLLKTLYANYSTFQARSNAGIRAFVLKTIYKYLPNRKCDPPLFNPPPLQPKRNMIEVWNLACLVLGGVVFGPSRRFLICYPWAKIWGWGGAAPGGQKIMNFYFYFSSFFTSIC